MHESTKHFGCFVCCLVVKGIHSFDLVLSEHDVLIITEHFREALAGLLWKECDLGRQEGLAVCYFAQYILAYIVINDWIII